MANTLDEKIEKLSKVIGELSDKMSDLGGGGALQSSNDEVRSAAEKNTLRKLKMEEALLEKKEKQTEDEWRKFKERQMYEESWIGKREKQLNNAKEIWGGVGRGISELYSKTKEYASKVWRVFNDAIGGIDKAAVSAYRTMGMSVDTMVKLRQHAVATANAFETARNFNASSADLLNLQVSYAKELGRNLNLNSSELTNMAAMRRLVGDEQAIKFTANFEKFGIDVNSASNEMVALFNEAAKTGLNFSKYSAMVADNLHLAQQYTFAKGIDGLKDMVKQSMAVRWNMQQTAAFAEKVSTVEGAITTSAQMSVLGGEFAKFANPMNMLYESLNDMESLNERLIKTFSQFATFNKRTNQIEVSAFDRMRIKSAAQAMGLDYGQVMDSVYGMGRAKVAEEQLRGSSLGEEYKTFLKNKAMIDRSNGKAYVNLMQEDGTYKQTYLSDITENDKKKMDREMRTESQDIKSIAKSAQTIEEMLNGLKEHLYDKLRKWIEDKGGIEKVKELINKIADAAIDVAKWAIKHAKPLLIGIASTLGTLLLTTKLIIPIMKAIQMNKISKSVQQMAYPYASAGGMSPIGSAMMGNPIRSTMTTPPAAMMNNQLTNLLNAKQNAKGSWSVPGIKGFVSNTKYQEMLAGAKKAAAVQGGAVPAQGGGFMDRLMYGKMGGMSAGARMMSGLGLGIGGSLLSMGGNMAHANGSHGWGAGLNIAGSAMNGAAMLSFLGPWGMLAGGIIGGAFGGISEWMGSKERERQEKYQKEQEEKFKKNSLDLALRGIRLNGEYTPDELEDMNRGWRYMSSATKQRMIEQGDGDMIEQLYGEGGFVVGRSHAHGGVSIKAEGGEAIIPVDETQKNKDAVKSLIDGSFNKKYTPMVAEKPMGNIMKVSETNSSQIGVNRIDFSSLNMNMGGTLRLELMGNNKDIDARKLLDDPKFNRTLEGMIRENVAVLGNRDKRHALSRYDNPDPNGRHVKWS